MSEEGQEPIIVAQLGSDPRFTSDERWDERKLGVIQDDMPNKFKPAYYFEIYKSLMDSMDREESKSVIELAQEHFLPLTRSIGGRGIRDLLYAEQVKRGIGINLKREIPKPTLYDKIMRREMVRQYEAQEADELDLE